ncbi:MAG: hypothetical protein UT22_C0007G0025 [Parcubacteria group bacterium GW2011_GWC2_39_11]|nr:MAG: hypothetical protein US88_C0005G0036 [Parcubacteria group bacterium GW2011_GWA2_38_27]KKQ97839.1 MAG: hypothetical protein UT22_C0007G0025 [Parcubacteria group bacterium GW2011_GWC2_39_11]
MNGISKLILRGTSAINETTLENLKEIEKKCQLCHSWYIGRVGDSGVCPACRHRLNGNRRNSGGGKIVRSSYSRKKSGKMLAE